MKIFFNLKLSENLEKINVNREINNIAKNDWPYL